MGVVRRLAIIFIVVACSHAAAVGSQAAIKSEATGPSQVEVNLTATKREPSASKLKDKPAIYAPNCAGPLSREDASFCEERQSRNVAERSVRVAEKSFWAAIGGTAVVALSLIFTGWAAVAAGRAARAADDAVKVSRETMTWQLRAYITFDKITVAPMPIHGQREGRRIGAEWINGGSTPARHATGLITWGAFPGELPGDFKFPFSGLSTSGSSTVGPGLPLLLSCPNPIPREIFEWIGTGRNRVYIWAYVEYRDIFNISSRVHRTEFAAELVMNPSGSGSESEMVIMPIERHNGMDGDCHSPEIARHVVTN